jgi:hypothetical protein
LSCTSLEKHTNVSESHQTGRTSQLSLPIEMWMKQRLLDICAAQVMRAEQLIANRIVHANEKTPKVALTFPFVIPVISLLALFSFSGVGLCNFFIRLFFLYLFDVSTPMRIDYMIISTHRVTTCHVEYI